MRHTRKPITNVALPHWQFVCENDQTWTWRAAHTVSAPFATREAAIENAKRCGFDPVDCYWTATGNGHTTHYRPGKVPIRLPAALKLDE